jgi:hypothetical protein
MSPIDWPSRIFRQAAIDETISYANALWGDKGGMTGSSAGCRAEVGRSWTIGVDCPSAQKPAWL